MPGLGHIYKGYRLIGLLLMFIGTPMAVALALLIATGTAGFGFFLLPIYWIAVMVHVWAIPDRVVTTIRTRASNTEISPMGPIGRYGAYLTAARISSRISRRP